MRTVAEWLARLAAFCAAMAFFRWGYVVYTSYLDRFSATFEREWGPWAQWTALFAMAGFVFGLACVNARPARYRLRVPLAVTLPALVLLGHFVLMIENGGPTAELGGPAVARAETEHEHDANQDTRHRLLDGAANAEVRLAGR